MDISTMNALINTLGTIKCEGPENWKKLLGCIQVLENAMIVEEAKKNEKDSKAE